MSDISSFEFVWHKWIVPLVNDLFKQTDADFVSYVGLKTRNMDELAEGAEKYFKKKRTELKIEFYGKGYADGEHRMDFHKLGALFCRTLIEYKVFDFDISKCETIVQGKSNKDIGWLVKNALINFRLSFYTSVVFLYQSMLFKYDKDESRQLFEGLKKNKHLDLYETNKKSDLNTVHESFENSVVLDLAKRDINNRSFDFLLYATIMYQLEEYNKAIILNSKN